MKSDTFYPYAAAFFAGVFVFSFLGLYQKETWALLALAAAALATFTFSRKRLALILCGVIVSFVLGAMRIESVKGGGHPLDSLVGVRTELRGLVCDEPAGKGTIQRFCFSPEGSRDRVIVTLSRYPAYAYGDELSIGGVLVLPKNFEAYEGGPEFDYVSYLSADDIRYEMYMPKASLLSSGGGNPVMALLLRIKGAFVSRMNRLMPSPQSSLLGGILIGDKASLPDDVTEDFKNAGLVHILVLSGYNVTIVAEGLMKVFSFLPRIFGRSLGALSIAAFALMTGASATTVRASIMALIAILAKSSARRYDVSRALIAAAFLMVAENPRILAFDVSFQLSFLATLALVSLSPIVFEKLSPLPEKWKIREIVATTVSTQIFVLPLLLYDMGRLSVISPLSNLYVLPAVPYAMLSGFIAVSVGFISPVVAAPFSWITTAILSYMLKAASFFGSLPFSSVSISIGAPTLFLIYGVYALVLWRISAKRKALEREGFSGGGSALTPSRP